LCYRISGHVFLNKKKLPIFFAHSTNINFFYKFFFVVGDFTFMSASQLEHLGSIGQNETNIIKSHALIHTFEQVKSFDPRAGEISNEWELHEQRVNSIDIHPENTNLIATSSRVDLCEYGT
jgi:hypothetical protein